jgi:hypothetical protein
MATKNTKHEQARDRDTDLRAHLDALCDEDDFAGGLPLLQQYPKIESRRLTPFEDDLRDWGFVYGLAFGLAMSANPDLTHAQAAELAYVPARKIGARWGGEIVDPAERREQAIRALARQYADAVARRDADYRAGRSGDLEWTSGLHGAVQELVENAVA